MGLLSDLSELTLPALTDLMLVRDVSDVTNPDKRMTVARLADLYLRSNILLVDAGFDALDATWGRFDTIVAAVAAAQPGDTILVAPGIYTGSFSLGDHGISIIGSGEPYYDSATGRLIGGTIIRGRISMDSYVGLTFRDFGVDMVGQTAGQDCIGASGPSTGDAMRRFLNLTILGQGTADLAHGIYGIGDNNIFDNIKIYDCHHGMAIHGSYATISNITFTRCGGTTLVIKAKNTQDCRYITVNGIVMQGDPASTAVRSGSLAIQCEDGLEVKHISINGVMARYCVNGVIQMKRTDTTGTISYVSLIGVQSENNLDIAGVGDFWIQTGDKVTLMNCSSTVRTAGYGFRVDAADNVGDVYAYSSSSDFTGAGAFTGTFKVMEMNGLLWGANRVQIALADDTATNITPPDSAGSMIISCGNDVGVAAYINYRAASSPFCQKNSGGADTNVTTGVLAGTTGTDVKYTVSAHTDGKIYLENRKGASRTATITFLT